MLCHQFKPTFFPISQSTTNINVYFSTPEETARIADRGWRRPFKARHGLAGIVYSRTPSHRLAQFEFVASKKLRRIFFRDSATPEDPLEGDTCTQSARCGPTSFGVSSAASRELSACKINVSTRCADTVGSSSALTFFHFTVELDQHLEVMDSHNVQQHRCLLTERICRKP